MSSFSEKVVVITGGAGGIGRGLARRFGHDGARIALLDLHPTRLKETVEALQTEGIQARGFTCDVTDSGACASAVTQVREAFGPIDVLVNNAGIVHRSPFEETDVEVTRRVMEVNFLGAVHCTKAALPDLRKTRGLIIVVSSIAGVAPLLGRAGYAASKHALHGFFESLRAELAGTGVAVTIACPGFTDSGFDSRALNGQGAVHGVPRSKVGRLATVDSVASAIHAGALRRRRLIVLTPVGKVSYLLSRLWPSAYAWIMARSLASELRGPSPKRETA